jgi:hypothetical protein
MSRKSWFIEVKNKYQLNALVDCVECELLDDATGYAHETAIVTSMELAGRYYLGVSTEGTSIAHTLPEFVGLYAERLEFFDIEPTPHGFKVRKAKYHNTIDELYSDLPE